MTTPLTSDSNTQISTKQLGRRRISCVLVLPTLAVLFLTAGLGLALIFYLLAKKIPDQSLHQIIFVNGSLFADEGVKYLSDGQQDVNLRGLIITSTIVSSVFFISLHGPL